VHWVLLDIGIAVLALLLMALVSYALYRRVRALLRTVRTASKRVGEFTPGLAVHQPVSKS
jgi:hypothetical protein